MQGQIVLTMPLLCGLDGHIKMSKSKGNYIGLTEHPNDMFGKTMSIPDFLIPEWVELTTDWTPAQKAEAIADVKNGVVNPMEVKKKIAFNIVEQYHSKEAAEEAAAFFYKQVQQKGFDTKEFEEVLWSSLPKTDSIGIVDLGAHLLGQSKSNIRRLIEGGAVSVDSEKISDVNFVLTNTGNEVKLKLGKRGFFTLK